MSGFGVNTNISSLIAQTALQNIWSMQSTSFQRLATGLAINRGADGPAALISSENLRATLRALESESRALQRTNSVLSVADSALGEISGLLGEAEALAVANANTAGLTESEREANQLALDSILQTVDRIASTTTFAGQPLIDGSLSVELGGDEPLVIDDAHSPSLGQTEIDGQAFALSDVSSGGPANIVDGDLDAAQAVINAARDEVSMLQGEVGAASRFSITPQLRGIAVAIENTAAAQSIIRDTDFAAEIANLTRLQILSSASMMSLGLSGSAPMQVLNLLTPVSWLGT